MEDRSCQMGMGKYMGPKESKASLAFQILFPIMSSTALSIQSLFCKTVGTLYTQKSKGFIRCLHFSTPTLKTEVLFLLCICIWRVCTNEYRYLLKSEVSDPLELESQMAVSHLT